MPNFSASLPTARELMSAATKHRGMDSLTLMPIRGGINFIGKALESIGAKKPSAGNIGEELTSKYILQPSEKITSGVGEALGEIPLIGRLFKYNLRPEDVIDASRAGVKLSDKQLAELSRKAHAGELYSHRLTAPFESKWTYNMVMPMLAGMYVQDQWDKPKSSEQISLERRNAHNLNMFNSLMGNRGSGHRKIGGINMNSSQNQKSTSDKLLLEAADHIDRLTDELKKVSMEKTAARAENELLKKAVRLVAQGSMDASFVDDFVKEGMSKQGMTMSSPSPNLSNTPSRDADSATGSRGGSLRDLYSETNSYIPKHAQGLLKLHEPHASEQRGDTRGSSGSVRPERGSAHQVLDDFVLS